MLDPSKKHPMVMPDGTAVEQVVHLRAVIDHPRIEVGEFSYYHNFEKLENYAGYLAPYLFPLSLDRLIIGKFVQIAHGVRFITSSANHAMGGFSTYPFDNFTMNAETTGAEIAAMFEKSGNRGDTVVGNDVWIGLGATIMPGVTIGDGAIIGSHAVVAGDVAPYTVVAGNPARPVRKRFDEEVIESLLAIRWWEWPTEKIEKNIDVITGGDIDALKRCSRESF
ncbi:CatB-related O-acetyltransferase [Sulfurimonas sp. HSL1-2]|uniref:CatB-related O-acetyltransferase n=1 Tax=Thiomicrolovo zhangzhouensis TaxID=3131933 RepID=UPI0033664762